MHSLAQPRTLLKPNITYHAEWRSISPFLSSVTSVLCRSNTSFPVCNSSTLLPLVYVSMRGMRFTFTSPDWEGKVCDLKKKEGREEGGKEEGKGEERKRERITCVSTHQ